MEEYKKEFEKEVLQFLFLADERDAKILISKYKRKNLPEFIRLACIALAYGYRKLFLKITATVEKDMDEFMKGIDNLNGKFDLVDGWINAFNERIKDREAHKLARECWEEKRAVIDKNNFDIKQLP